MNGLHKVVITDFVCDGLELERRELEGLATVEALNAHAEDELIGHIEDADALMVYHHLSLSEKSIFRLNDCKMIVRCGVGVDNIACAAARVRGILVANVPDYGTEEVADTASGMALAMTRGIHFLNSRLRAGQGPWTPNPVAPLQRLRGQVFGIVGLGRIGTAVAIRAGSLGCDVAFYDPYKDDGYDKALGIRRVESFEELLAASYVISLNCPLSDETQHMIDRQALQRMRAGSYLVNTARGGVIDPLAVAEALGSGQLAGAAIDVLDQEPPTSDHALIAAWRNPDHPAHHRLLINPHAAFYCEQGFVEMRLKAARACRLALQGQPVRSLVD
jgi:D-3-phosphoglycerate dehydrogenase/C-terminal binding protein